VIDRFELVYARQRDIIALLRAPDTASMSTIP
jgi:hypothetical protein